jgi:hypothetical protein
MRRLPSFLIAALLLAGPALFAQDVKPKTVSLVVKGVV